ncbi:MAG: phage tail tape measure protein [Planctomycetota bacterium]|nr:phage tail tape measure protein [Planctomycetota bacterium]
MATNFGPLGVSYVEIDADLEPFQKTLNTLKSRKENLTQTVKLDTSVKQAASEAKSGLFAPMAAGAIAFGGGIRGGLAFLGAKLTNLQAESRVIGSSLQKAFGGMAHTTDKMVKQFAVMVKYSKDAETNIIRATLAEKLPSLRRSIVRNSRAASSPITLPSFSGSNRAAAVLNGLGGNARALAQVANRAFHAMVADLQRVRLATNSVYASFVRWQARVSTLGIVLRKTAQLALLPFRVAASGISLLSRAFGTYEGKVKSASGRLGMFGTVARGVINPIKGMVDATRGAGSAVSRLGNTVGGIASRFKLAGLVAGGVLAAGIYKSVQAASAQNEALSYAKVRWGANFDAVKSFTDALAESTGAAKTWTLESMNMFGGIIKDVGIADSYVSGMSMNLTKLAQDVASARNITVEEAQNKLKGGLTGETEGLKAIGVVMNSTMIENEMLAMGVKKTGGEFSEGAKVAARYSLMMKKLKDDQGDLARTGDGVANSSRELQGRWENMLAVIGEKLLPVASQFLGLLNSFVGVAQGAAEGSGSWFDWLAEKIGGVFQTIGLIMRNWTEIWDIIGLYVENFGTNVAEAFDWLGKAFMSTGDWILNNWRDIVTDLGGMLYHSFFNHIANIKNLWTNFTNWLSGTDAPQEEYKSLLDGFTRKSKELVLPDLKMSVVDQERLGKLGAKIEANEAAKPGKAPEVPYTEVDAKAAALSAKDESKKDKKESSFVGVLEYFKKLQTDSMKMDIPKQQLTEARAQTGHLESMDVYLGKMTEFIQNIGGPQAAVAGK